MPKIDYQELKVLSDELTALRQTTVSHLEDYEQSNDAFTSDTILTGTAWDSGKGYHKNYKIISRSIFNALYDIDDSFKAHLAAFKAVVGEAENRLDTDELVDLENELRRLQTQKLEFMEAMAEVFKDVPILKDFFAQNTMNGTIKEIELLKRYEHFENTTQGSFDGVYETIGAITEALAFMGESKNFAGGSKGYNEVNFAALGWHQQLDKYNQANEEDRYEIREIKTKYGTFYQVLKNGKVQKEASEALQYSELLDALGGMAKLTPEILKILVGLDDVEILLDDGSTTVQKMGSSIWILLSVLPPDKIKDILKSAKLAKNSGKALDGIHITEKQWKEYKALDKTVGGAVDDIPTAFKQTEFASTYEARLGQTPALVNKKVQFVGARGESLSTLKPPPDAKLESILKNAGVEGVYYKNGVPDFSPFSKAEIEIEYMLGGKGALGSKARDFNFQQANSNLAKQLNDSPSLAKTFGMESGNIKPRDIEKYRVQNNLTWHELNNGTTIQLVPSEINSTFGHIGGVGEINAGAFVK